MQVVGACWYMLSIERQQKCWSQVCDAEPLCSKEFLDCFSLSSTNLARASWLSSTSEAANCTVDNFNYGIYVNAIANNITGANFLTRYFYSLWLGLLALRYIFKPLTWV